jgi:uncharacterized metal-binding protein YceD (DUF177 family)
LSSHPKRRIATASGHPFRLGIQNDVPRIKEGTRTRQEDVMTDPLTLPFPVRALSPKKPTRFDLTPDAATRAAIAAGLEITSIRSLQFKGELRPAGRRDILLEAVLSARVEQPCGITLTPVFTDLHEVVTRRYVAEWVEPDGTDVEMPEDDTSEALPDVIDVGLVAVEALTLALPMYPRAPGASLPDATFAEPGVTPLKDGDLKPFASLAALKDKLGKP